MSSLPASRQLTVPLNQRVLSYVELFQGRLHEFMENGMRRGSKYLPMIQNVFRAEGLPLDPIAEELGKNLDPFDLICHVAFDKKPLTRRERAEDVKKRDVFTKYPQARAVLDALLEKYRDEGVLNLDDANVLKVTPFTAMGSVVQLIKAFGGKEGFEKAVHELQDALYQETA